MLNLKPRTWDQLDGTLEEFKGLIESARFDPNNLEHTAAFKKIGEDLAGCVESVKAAQKDATLAAELAKDLAASGPAKRVDARAFSKLPLVYSYDRDPELLAMFGRNKALFNVLMFTRDDMHGLDDAEVKAVERLRYINAQLVTMDALMLGQRDPGKVHDYIKAGRMETLPLWKEWVDLSRMFKAAMDTAEAGAGLEWVPTGVNTALISDVRPEHMTRSMFQTYAMNRSPQLFPVQGAAFRAFLLSETTVAHRSGTVIGSRDSATASTTFTAKKFGALTDYSREMVQDSIVALATTVRVDHAYAHGETDESTIWNAQLTAMGGTPATSSTFDTGETFGATTQQVDDRAAWDGIRALYAAGSCTTPGNAGAGLNADLFTDQFGAMGRYGINPSRQFIGTSYLGFAKALVIRDSANQNVTLTAEKAGGRGTFDTGVLAQMFGRPLIPSTQYPQTLDASGVISGGGTKTAYHIVHRDRFGMGEVQVLEIAASDQVGFATDQTVVRSISRKHWKPYVTPNSTTETSIGAIYNV